MSVHDGGAVASLEPANGEMSVRKALKMVHEDHVDGGAANGTDDRHGAGGGRSEATKPKRDAISLTTLLTTVVEAALATPRSSSNADASWVSRVNRVREA